MVNLIIKEGPRKSTHDRGGGEDQSTWRSMLRKYMISVMLLKTTIVVVMGELIIMHLFFCNQKNGLHKPQGIYIAMKKTYNKNNGSQNS